MSKNCKAFHCDSCHSWSHHINAKQVYAELQGKVELNVLVVLPSLDNFCNELSVNDLDYPSGVHVWSAWRSPHLSSYSILYSNIPPSTPLVILTAVKKKKKTGHNLSVRTLYNPTVIAYR